MVLAPVTLHDCASNKHTSCFRALICTCWLLVHNIFTRTWAITLFTPSAGAMLLLATHCDFGGWLVAKAVGEQRRDVAEIETSVRFLTSDRCIARCNKTRWLQHCRIIHAPSAYRGRWSRPTVDTKCRTGACKIPVKRIRKRTVYHVYS